MLSNGSNVNQNLFVAQPDSKLTGYKLTTTGFACNIVNIRTEIQIGQGYTVSSNGKDFSDREVFSLFEKLMLDTYKTGFACVKKNLMPTLSKVKYQIYSLGEAFVEFYKEGDISAVTFTDTLIIRDVRYVLFERRQLDKKTKKLKLYLYGYKYPQPKMLTAPYGFSSTFHELGNQVMDQKLLFKLSNIDYKTGIKNKAVKFYKKAYEAKELVDTEDVGAVIEISTRHTNLQTVFAKTSNTLTEIPSPYGAGVITNNIELLDSLDETESLAIHDLREGKILNYIPEHLLQRDANGKLMRRNA